MKTYQVKSVHLESKVWLGANSTTHLKLSKIALENVAHSRDMTDHFLFWSNGSALNVQTKPLLRYIVQLKSQKMGRARPDLLTASKVTKSD